MILIDSDTPSRKDDQTAHIVQGLRTGYADFNISGNTADHACWGKGD
jgi:hypothetical protein